ncbi:helix-turn-helix domain-containing protein [[Ruminococcus] torques]|uniref:helix-turn-helix domain-containing protein n=1 Tax=[Ruminococcus] torques TaxID=33039 RepID=UPI00352217B0
MNIGEQINNLRKQHGLSQDDFANLFNVSRQTISNWENGKSYPDLEMIIKVSDYFKISIDELLKNDVQTVKKIDNEKKGKKEVSYTIASFMFFRNCYYLGIIQ